jgi:protein-tyrosine-phosphatase
LGRRLARRCWPGPVTLVYENGTEAGLTNRLHESVRQRVCPGNTVGLRTPAHQAVLQTLRLLPGPLVLTSANRSGEPDATTAEQVMGSVGDQIALVIDDGPSRYGQASTVVQVNGNAWKILREGVVSEAVLERLSSCMIVFVCTGNTCRSPLAEGLFKKLLAQHLHCAVEELLHQGFVVLSAGLAAMRGGEAAPEAIEVARELGVVLDDHVSQPLTPQMMAQADLVIPMTNSHLQALRRQQSGLGCRLRLLCSDGKDISDPIGYDLEVYRECARQILGQVEKLVPEVQP